VKHLSVACRVDGRQEIHHGPAECHKVLTHSRVSQEVESGLRRGAGEWLEQPRASAQRLHGHLRHKDPGPAVLYSL
jgi:hypothetical protein